MPRGRTYRSQEFLAIDDYCGLRASNVPTVGWAEGVYFIRLNWISSGQNNRSRVVLLNLPTAIVTRALVF